MKYDRVIVLGGGITGLSTAWSLLEKGIPVTVIEKEADPGGLAATFTKNGFRFDYGPHNLHSAYDDMIEFYSRLLKDDFREKIFNVKLYIFGKLVSYPLVGADVLLSLKGSQMIKATLDFVAARASGFIRGFGETEHLDEWIVRRFGRTLYETYFGPYIERIWKTDPHNLAKSVGEEKIPIISIRNYIKREILGIKKRDARFAESWHYYYVRKGVGRISEKFVEDINQDERSEVLLDETVDRINIKNGRVTSIETSKRAINTEKSLIISTLPIDILMQDIPELPQTVKSAADSLEYCSERFLFVSIKKPSVSGLDWSYFSDNRYPFSRVTEFRNDYFEMAPEGCTGLTFEFPCNKNDDIWNADDEELVRNIVKLYGEVFPLRQEDIIDCTSKWQRQAYPRFKVGYDKSIREIFLYLRNVSNILSIGRQGMFCYLNMDNATKLGVDAATAVHTEQDLHSISDALIQKYHKIKLNA